MVNVNFMSFVIHMLFGKPHHIGSTVKSDILYIATARHICIVKNGVTPKVVDQCINEQNHNTNYYTIYTTKLLFYINFTICSY